MTSFTSAARQVARQTGLAVREARVVGSQHGYQHLMLTLAGGQRAFAKVAAAATGEAATGEAATGEAATGEAAPDAMAAAFAAEASSLRWLAEADAVPVPEVLAFTGAALVISMIPPGHATPSAAFRFGTELARLHAAGSEDFGAPWRGFIASLPLDNTPMPPGRPPAPRQAGPHALNEPHRPHGPRGRSGTRAAGCCPTCAGRWTPAPSGQQTGAWWRR